MVFRLASWVKALMAFDSFEQVGSHSTCFSVLWSSSKFLVRPLVNSFCFMLKLTVPFWLSQFSQNVNILSISTLASSFSCSPVIHSFADCKQCEKALSTIGRWRVEANA